MLKDFILNQKRHCKISDGPRLNLNYVRIIPDSIWKKKIERNVLLSASCNYVSSKPDFVWDQNISYNLETT